MDTFNKPSPPEQGSSRANKGPSGYSLPLVKIAGIQIRLDLSVVIIFALIVFSLANNVFPIWHADWGPGLIWVTAVTSGVLFFVSLLAHELSHSLVSQHYGIPVPRITLFLFGGMAERSHEPDQPGVEFQVAIAGPLASVVISLVCSMLVSLMVGDAAIMSRIASAETDAMAMLGPVETSLLWLGSINMILAVFNMIPGFPMDGGRVFRAAMWAITGDKLKATLWASNLGRLFGWTLMVVGAITVFGGGNFGGLWWILIGWFISNLARMGYAQLVTEQALKGFRIRDLMNVRFGSVSPDTPLEDFIHHSLLRSEQAVWPVVDGDELKGYAIFSDVVKTDPERRGEMSVGDLTRPVSELPALDANHSARDALEAMHGAVVEPLPVCNNGSVVGFLSRADVLRWMALHEVPH